MLYMRAMGAVEQGTVSEESQATEAAVVITCEHCGERPAKQKWTRGVTRFLCGGCFWACVRAYAVGDRRLVLDMLIDTDDRYSDQARLFTTRQVQEIRLRHDMGDSVEMLAREYGRSVQNMRFLVQGITYQMVDRPVREVV
ncbi:MAG: hypothetical protein KC419_14415 [Anaerolineales bacterium]|nr:hypothetical protein [Anaerolineales bacterium]